MTKIFAVLATLGLFTSALAQTSCQNMFSGLKCRTFTEDPTQIDANSVTNSRNWLCSSYSSFCKDINSGGTYSSCNSVEQLSYAMNLYYTQFQSQGASACSFGGIGVVINSATPATSAPAATTATQSQCQSMFAQASCRTSSEDPTQVDAGGVTNSRGWLCSVYPQFCLAISSGGAYSTCNSVEQLSWAMSLYYNQFKSQGASACNFNGIGFLNSGSTPATSAAAATPATTASSSTSGVNCTAMFISLTCRTTSQNPAALSASGLTNSRAWLCSTYPSMCNGINTGGSYASCNAAEQLSYAMNTYYQQFSYQGASACSFGGMGQIVSSSSGSVVVGPAPVAALSSKAGLAWPINQFGDGTNPSLAPWAQGQISWIYTWSWDYSPLAIGSTNLEWVPMLHSQTDAGNFISKIQSGAYDNVKNILLFNEPDLNYPPYAYAVDVNTAISITLQVFQAIQARGKSWSARVGTPAMSYNMGWLQQYLSGVSSQCPTCKFSFVPVHMYTTDSNAFKANVQNYYNTFGLPVWVTEFAATDFSSRSWQMSQSSVNQFMSDTTNWLNAQSWVERYSWFGVMRAVDIQDKANMAMNSDGSRNALGDQYVLRGGSSN